MRHTLILFSTTDGQTQKIAEHIEQRLSQHMTGKVAFSEVTLRNLDDYLAEPISLTAFDTIVIGASVRYGKHKQSVVDFISQNHAMLSDKTFAFFSVNLTARKPEKATPETSRYTQKLYASIPVNPDIDAVFAGKLDYPRYGFFDRHIIRLIMKMTGGPTDPTTVKEYTDWSQVDEFADALTKTAHNRLH